MGSGVLIVVEDDASIRRAVRDALEFHGYRTHEAEDGRAGLDLCLTVDADLVLLDIMMPRLDGLSMLTELRKARPRVPVILLTARGEEQDKVRGLKLGADDYVVKPFGVDELIARVEAVLRRSAERPEPVARLEISGRLVDFARREARVEGRVVALTEKEAEVLRYLASCPGRAVSREELLRAVWGLNPRGMSTRTVDMAVARLRESLGDDPGSPAVIVTVRGRGYMLASA
jgi:DNA-binding response OmpR family regulator